MRLRIVKPFDKFLYGLFGYLAVIMVSLLGSALGGAPVGAVVVVAAFSAWIIIGARLFRIEDEPLDAPRPWWRLTGRPAAGFVIAALFALQALGSWAASLTGGVTGPTSGATTTVCAIAAVAYLGSSLRLRRP